MLNKKQIRIKNDKRRCALNAKANNNNSKDLNKQQIGLVITRYSRSFLVESEDNKLYKCTQRKNVESPVAGDKVVFHPLKNDDGIITALVPRKNQFKRVNKAIASNIDKLHLVVAIQPHYQFELINRYLIIAHSANLSIDIIVNKVDLLTDLQQLKQDFSIYQALGHSINYVSVLHDTNIDKLKNNLKDKNNIFIGQSGVGKSSLINLLLPELELKTRSISTQTKLGKHTTTNTSLYHLPSGGNIFDSPGINEFPLTNLSKKQILDGFVEFKDIANGCKFADCWHINEPFCAVKEIIASKSGLIHEKRYQGYLDLIAQI